jgi:hypothetical protein
VEAALDAAVDDLCVAIDVAVSVAVSVVAGCVFEGLGAAVTESLSPLVSTRPTPAVTDTSTASAVLNITGLRFSGPPANLTPWTVRRGGCLSSRFPTRRNRPDRAKSSKGSVVETAGRSIRSAAVRIGHGQWAYQHHTR